jgi:hypothetical protein
MAEDFEEVTELLNRTVEELLASCGIEGPPVDARKIADTLGIVYSEEELRGRRGQSFRRQGHQHVEVHRRDRPERKNFALAHEIMELELKKVLEDPRECHRKASLGASFLLMPSRWFREECLRSDFDLWELKKTFSTASWEAIALRTLNFSEAIVTVLDNGRVTRRKSSYPYYVSGKLSDAEKEVAGEVLHTGAAQTRHFPSCEVTAWPIFEEEHRRVILRTILDEWGEG